MLRWLCALFACLIPAMPASAQAPTHRIEAADRQSVSASIGYEIGSTNFAVSRWMVYLADPPELPSQIKVKVTSKPASKVMAEKSPLARKVRLFDLTLPMPMAGAQFVVRQDIEAVLRSRKLVPLGPDDKPPAVPALTAAERKFYLAPSRHIDFDRTSFKEWLSEKKLQRARNESAIAYAERVLSTIRSSYEYKFDPAAEKRAAVLCSRAATDCGGMSLVFVGAMRTHDIPARVLVGRFALPRRPGSNFRDTDYDQPHVRAEFHVPGIGWIPVDPAVVNRQKDRPIAELIGHDPGDLLVQHVDLDLRLQVLDKEQNADLLQIEPYLWTVGRGKLDVALVGTKWDVKSTTLDGK